MQRLLTWILLAFLLPFGLWGQQPDFAPAGCKYNTIAHRLLHIEELAFNAPQWDYDQMYQVLDAFIDRASSKIKPLLNQENLTENQKAQEICQAIDATLWEMDFIVCIKTHFLSQCLQKSELPLPKTKLHWYTELDPRPEDQSQYHCASLNTTAYPQQTLMSAAKKEAFLNAEQLAYHLIDCDLSTCLYLAVGEVLDLPIFLVEVPGHVFVRYHFSDGAYLNWDTNAAKTFSDDDYRKGWNPSAKKPFSWQEEQTYPYLKSLNREEATALHTRFIVKAPLVEANPRLAQSILSYVEGLNPNSPVARTRIAEGYRTFGEQKNLEGEPTEAVPHFEKALKLHPEQTELHNQLGFALIREGKTDEGRDHLAAALIKGKPAGAAAYRNWGSYYAATGHPRKASRQFRKAKRLSQQELLDLLETEWSALLLKRGKTRKAQQLLKAAAKRGEVEARRRLKALNTAP